jgi:FlaA1/EpsC-like NDP-sugar epimerase
VKFKHRSRLYIFINDLLMVAGAWFGAYWLRFNLDIPSFYINVARQDFLYVLAIQAFFFWLFGLYRGVWRFSSLPDLICISKVVLAGVFTIGFSFFLYNRMIDIPRAVLPLYFFLLLVFLCVPRFFFRFWRESVLKEGDGKRVLIVGAGMAGEMLVRDLQGNRHSGYIPVAFVDDDQQKRKRDIRGLRVVGNVTAIPKFVEKLNLDGVLIAVPSANDKEMRRIVEMCEACDTPFQTLPSVKELLSGTVSRGNLRDVSIEDVLGREPIRLDWEKIKASLQGKKVLVTGGGGSIGSELCKQLTKVNPKQIIVFDQSEFNLYKIDCELKQNYSDLDTRSILGDVSDRITVRKMLEGCKPDVIFHAAAYKHVPLLENQVREAVHNNVIGTKILAEEAIKAGVERFILISTDKAVNPTNVMGASKRAAEILCQNLNDVSSTSFTTVRFGNVLDSAGSVVPLFRQQIKAGGPVTVTDPQISRYFMTIPEACQLIMKAESVGNGGEVFVLDMGEPIKIKYLAEQMIRLSGKQPDKDIRIEYIGLRCGEKLHEELFHQHEQLIETGYKKLLLAKARTYDKTTLISQIEDLTKLCAEGSEDEILEQLKSMVPEFLSIAA